MSKAFVNIIEDKAPSEFTELNNLVAQVDDHEIYEKFMKIHKFQENSCFGVPGSAYDRCNH